VNGRVVGIADGDTEGITLTVNGCVVGIADGDLE